MSADVLLNLLNPLRKRENMLETPRILNLSLNSLNKFNNADARMINSIYHVTLKLLLET